MRNGNSSRRRSKLQTAQTGASGPEENFAVFRRTRVYKKRPLVIKKKTFAGQECTSKLVYFDSADYGMHLDSERKVNQEIQQALYEQIKLAQSKFPDVAQDVLTSKLGKGGVDNAELMKRARKVIGRLQEKADASLSSDELDSDDQEEEAKEASKEKCRKAISDLLDKTLRLNRFDSAEFYMKVDLLKKVDENQK